MKTVSLLRRLAAFVLAVVVASIWGSLFQTQHNLAQLGDLGAEIGVGLRLQTTLLDLVGFAPVYAAIVAATFLVAFLVAGLLSRLTPQVRHTLHALGAGIGLALAIRLVDALAPMPTLIAATRGMGGLLAMALGAVLAGWLYAWITRPRPG